jgi:histidine ammonia-lyase
VRKLVAPLTADRVLTPDLETLAALVTKETLP